MSAQCTVVEQPCSAAVYTGSLGSCFAALGFIRGLASVLMWERVQEGWGEKVGRVRRNGEVWCLLLAVCLGEEGRCLQSGVAGTFWG